MRMPDSRLKALAFTGITYSGKHYTTPVFLKPSEDIDKAIKRFMTGLKQKKDKRIYPKQFSSVEDYVTKYREANKGMAVCLDYKNLRGDDFSYPEGEEVIYSEDAFGGII